MPISRLRPLTHRPQNARRKQEKKKIDTGVELTLGVGTDGLVKDVSVSRPVSYYGLDEGKPASVQIHVVVNFRCGLS